MMGRMHRRKTANISLTPELTAFVESRVASGRYQTASEVVREALRLLEQREAQRISSIADLRREAEIGLAQAKAGRLTDGEVVFDRVLRKLKAGRPKAATRRRAG
jgi:antitoxin ParD1/3/4